MVDAFKTCGSSHPQDDIVVRDHGSLVLLEPLSDAGRSWLEKHCPDALTFGQAIVCEPRYVADIVNGARRDGLVVRAGYVQLNPITAALRPH